jgi:hypothetical protein
MRIHKENLIIALSSAIKFHSEKDKEEGIESTFVAGLKEVNTALEDSEIVEIDDYEVTTYIITWEGSPLTIIKAWTYHLPTEVLDWYAKEYDFDRRKLGYTVIKTTVICNKNSIKKDKNV